MLLFYHKGAKAQRVEQEEGIGRRKKKQLSNYKAGRDAVLESAGWRSVRVFCVLIFGIAGFVGVVSASVVAIVFVRLIYVARSVVVVPRVLVDIACLIGVV